MKSYYRLFLVSIVVTISAALTAGCSVHARSGEATFTQRSPASAARQQREASPVENREHSEAAEGDRAPAPPPTY